MLLKTIFRVTLAWKEMHFSIRGKKCHESESTNGNASLRKMMALANISDYNGQGQVF
jgi:hypothetical protein